MTTAWKVSAVGMWIQWYMASVPGIDVRCGDEILRSFGEKIGKKLET